MDLLPCMCCLRATSADVCIANYVLCMLQCPDLRLSAQLNMHGSAALQKGTCARRGRDCTVSA